VAGHRNISVQYDQQYALFACSLLRLAATTCFQHLFAHHQETLYVKQLVYFVRIMSAGCEHCWSGTHKNIPIAVYTVPPDDEQISARNMYRLLIAINLKQIAQMVGPIIPLLSIFNQ
jgi:hypothetical protein